MKNNHRLRVYLAGDLDRTTRWKNRVIKECQDCPITWFCPERVNVATHKTFHLNDATKVREADVIFVYLAKDSPSIFSGSSWEMGYAYGLRKTIITVCNMGASRKRRYELALRHVDPKMRCKNLDEGIALLRGHSLSLFWMPREE